MLTQQQLKDQLHYDPDTGEFTWRVARAGVRAGSRAGGIGGPGYWMIRINRKLYYRSRLAWLYTHGQWPKHEIDHINRDRLDDRIDNLRDVTHSQNNHNKPTGKGYYYRRSMKDFAARIKINGHTHHLGIYQTPHEARAAYLAVKRTHHPEAA